MGIELMLPWAKRLLSNERELRMIWQLEKGGRRSVLVGAAHFFPYRFQAHLRILIGGAETVLLEGPLDEQAVRRVLHSGHGLGGGALYDALDAAARQRVLGMLGVRAAPLDAHQLLKELLFGRQDEWLESELRALKPWMAFFGIWSRFRIRHGWTYTLDLDAARIATELGKEIRYLETIDEQIAALDSVPLERMVRFLALDNWTEYCAQYVRHYLAGDIVALLAATRIFPTYCEPIIDRRDPLLAERMLSALAAGDALAIVGVTHCPGVIRALRNARFTVTGVSGDPDA